MVKHDVCKSNKCIYCGTEGVLISLVLFHQPLDHIFIILIIRRKIAVVSYH